MHYLNLYCQVFFFHEKCQVGRLFFCRCDTLLNMENTFDGILQMNNRGFGFVLTPEGEDDIFVSEKDLNGAIHGDTVQVRTRLRRGRTEGSVIKVLHRNNSALSKPFAVSIIFSASLFSKFIYCKGSRIIFAT